MELDRISNPCNSISSKNLVELVFNQKSIHKRHIPLRLHIPTYTLKDIQTEQFDKMEKNLSSNPKSPKESKTKTIAGSDGKRVYYRVVEHLFQRVLPIYGEGMAVYDCRTIRKKIYSKVKAEALVTELQAQAEERNLSHQLQYIVETYTSTRSK